MPGSRLGGQEMAVGIMQMWREVDQIHIDLSQCGCRAVQENIWG